jgi:prolyl oligopeptidase
LQQLDLPTGVSVEFENDLMTVKPREAWKVGDRVYAADSLLAMSRRAFLDSNRDFTVLFEPAARKALQSFAFIDGKLLLHYKDNLENRFEAYDGTWQRLPFPALPQTGSVSVMALDAEPSDSNGDLLISVNDPVTPPTLSICAAGSTAPRVLKRAPVFFDASAVVITRHEAVSSDGERIPYVQIGPEDSSGQAPVHMTGYGGFGLPRRQPTTRRWASSGWRRAAPASSPTFAAAASSARPGMTPEGWPARSGPTTTLQRLPRIW